MASSPCRNGFTLIEVLIVVVIMAVLAAVIIPLVDNPATSAQESVLKQNLSVMRSQMELYRIDHLGKYPNIQSSQLPQLTRATNRQGETGLPGPDYPHGPYIVDLPPNPFDQSDKVTAVAVPRKEPTGVVGTLGGWQYDETTGSVWPNHAEYYQQTP